VTEINNVVSRRRAKPGGFVLAAVLCSALAPGARAQSVPKGFQILINQGLQVQGMVNGLTDPTGTATDTRQHVTLDFLFGTAAGHLTALDVLDPSTGLVNTVPLTSIGNGKYRWAFDLDGGSAELFKFSDGAPFVGVTPVPEPGTLGLVAAAGLLGWRCRWRRTRPAR
jgi:hypothetical protein